MVFLCLRTAMCICDQQPLIMVTVGVERAKGSRLSFPSPGCLQPHHPGLGAVSHRHSFTIPWSDLRDRSNEPLTTKNLEYL